MDAYQPIYDAVRSRLSNGDIGAAIEGAFRNENIGHHFAQAATRVQEVASAHDVPSAVFRPKIYIDGDQWCALYGDNLQDGVAGFGNSPSLAMQDFDKNWYAQLPKQPAAQGVPDGWRKLLILSQRNFKGNFGESLDADWIYRDIEELFSEGAEMIAESKQQAKLRNVRKLLDGSQPKDIAGAIMAIDSLLAAAPKPAAPKGGAA